MKMPMNNPDFSIYLIVALLPLSAFFLVIQVNPFYALIVRGMSGAIAALVYALLGAADVALTEALMGTLLAISLYVIAVRSSLVMRLGVLKQDLSTINSNQNSTEKEDLFLTLIDHFKSVVAKYYLRLELVDYEDKNTLKKALNNKEVHGICFEKENEINSDTRKNYQSVIRIERLYNIFQQEKNNSLDNLTYIYLTENKDKN
jgi:putative multicomponent Na+:H+ antiporter subunit B